MTLNRPCASPVLLLTEGAVATFVGGWRLMELALPLKDLIVLANYLAGWRSFTHRTEAELQPLLDAARRGAVRGSRLVPGASCLHRALAARVVLALHGVSGRIVIGFRKRDALEGHAWLAIKSGDGEDLLLFKSPADGYREVLDEQSVLSQMRFS